MTLPCLNVTLICGLSAFLLGSLLFAKFARSANLVRLEKSVFKIANVGFGKVRVFGSNEASSRPEFL